MICYKNFMSLSPLPPAVVFQGKRITFNLQARSCHQYLIELKKLFISPPLCCFRETKRLFLIQHRRAENLCAAQSSKKKKLQNTHDQIVNQTRRDFINLKMCGGGGSKCFKSIFFCKHHRRSQEVKSKKVSKRTSSQRHALRMKSQVVYLMAL